MPQGETVFPPLSSKCSELSVPLLPFEGGVLLNVEVLSAGLRQAQKKKSVLRKSFSTRPRGEIPAHLILNSQRICQIQAYPITNVWLVFTYFIGKFVQVPTIQLKKQSPDLTYICAISPTSKLTKTSGTLTVKSGQLPALSDSSGSYEGKTQALQGRDQQHKTEIKRYWNLSEFNLNSRRLGRSILEIICYVISKSLLILKIPFQVGYP